MQIGRVPFQFLEYLLGTMMHDDLIRFVIYLNPNEFQLCFQLPLAEL